MSAEQTMQRMLGGMAEMKIGADIIKGMINPAMNFQKAMANVSTMVDDTGEQMAFLTDEVRKMSRELPQTQDDLAIGLYQTLSAGITDSAEAIEVLGIASKAATAGVTTANVAVDAITTVLNAYGLAASEAQNVSDLMFQTVRRGKTTYEELASSLGRVTSTAAVAGVDFNELSAAFATMTKKGISAEETATALNQTLLAYIKPTDQAKKAAKDLGIELSAQSLQSKGLFQSMMDLANAEGANAEALAEMFPNVRALKGTLALTAGDAEVFNKDLEAMAKASDGAGAATVAFEKMMDSSAMQMQIYENRVNDIKIAMGENLLPTVMDTLGPMLKMLELYNKMPEPLQELIPLLIATGAAIMIVHGAALVLSLNPITIAIIATVAAVFLAYKLWQKYGDQINIVEAVSSILGQTFNKLSGFVIFLKDNTMKLIEPFETLYGWITKVTDAFEDFQESGIGKIAGGISDVGGAVLGAFHPIHQETTVPQTGTYRLKKGERVSPGASAAGNGPSTGGGVEKIEVNFNGITIRNDRDLRMIEQVVSNVLRKQLAARGAR